MQTILSPTHLLASESRTPAVEKSVAANEVQTPDSARTTSPYGTAHTMSRHGTRCFDLSLGGANPASRVARPEVNGVRHLEE